MHIKYRQLEASQYRNLVALLRIDVIELTFADLNRINFTTLGVNVTVQYIKHAKEFKGARTYCIINEATPSGTFAMAYFS